MCALCSFLKSTVGRKIIMALSGLILVLFVLGHMLGNLQIFLGPDVINEYAYHLHALPPVVMWAVRLFLLATIAVHIWAAVVLTMANRKARPEEYEAKASVQASYASRTMRMSGIILFAFIVFHIAHYTARNVPGMEYEQQISDVALVKHGEVVYNGVEPVMVFNVYDMMISGFQTVWVSIFYVVAMALLCIHLTHGVSSMFQSVGLRNSVWRPRLDRLAKAYGIIIFLGFASIPVSVLAGILKPMDTTAAVQSVDVEVDVLEVIIQK